MRTQRSGQRCSLVLPNRAYSRQMSSAASSRKPMACAHSRRTHERMIATPHRVEPMYPEGSTTWLEQRCREAGPDQCVRPPSCSFTSMPVTLLHVAQAASACENSCMKVVHSLNGFRRALNQSKRTAAR